MNEQLTGKIVLWRGDRQFGFIQPADGTDDCFFHLNDFDADEPVVNTEVTFIVEAPNREGQKRTAKAVTPISGQP